MPEPLIEFETTGELSDEAIGALAALLIDLTETDVPFSNQTEVSNERNSRNIRAV